MHTPSVIKYAFNAAVKGMKNAKETEASVQFDDTMFDDDLIQEVIDQCIAEGIIDSAELTYHKNVNRYKVSLRLKKNKKKKVENGYEQDLIGMEAAMGNEEE